MRSLCNLWTDESSSKHSLHKIDPLYISKTTVAIKNLNYYIFIENFIIFFANYKISCVYFLSNLQE